MCTSNRLATDSSAFQSNLHPNSRSPLAGLFQGVKAERTSALEIDFYLRNTALADAIYDLRPIPLHLYEPRRRIESVVQGAGPAISCDSGVRNPPPHVKLSCCSIPPPLDKASSASIRSAGIRLSRSFRGRMRSQPPAWLLLGRRSNRTIRHGPQRLNTATCDECFRRGS